jgi:hypothetical protein
MTSDGAAAHQHQTASAQAANEQHITAARRHAPVLIARARQLIRNGVDLGDPERFADFINDQVADAVNDTVLPGCHGGRTIAAAVLVAELARQLAEATR